MSCDCPAAYFELYRMYSLCSLNTTQMTPLRWYQMLLSIGHILHISMLFCLSLMLTRFPFLLKLNKLEQAIEDCTKAVKLDETYIKAYLRRAQW